MDRPDGLLFAVVFTGINDCGLGESASLAPTTEVPSNSRTGWTQSVFLLAGWGNVAIYDPGYHVYVRRS